MFESTEKVGMENNQIDLACSRNNVAGDVVWETVHSNNTVIDTIYRSGTSDDPIDGYEIIGNGNDFDLRINISQTTAILTRCTVSQDGFATVFGTAMVYCIGKYLFYYILRVYSNPKFANRSKNLIWWKSYF